MPAHPFSVGLNGLDEASYSTHKLPEQDRDNLRVPYADPPIVERRLSMRSEEPTSFGGICSHLPGYLDLIKNTLPLSDHRITITDMRITKTLLWISLFAVLAPSCKKDELTPDVGIPPTSGITITLTGRVLDLAGSFIPNATIQMNGRSTTSDALGVFRMTGVPAHEGRNFVRVDKPGYFFGGRNIHVFENGSFRIQAVLAPRSLIGSFQAGSGGTVQTVEGFAVQIPANGIAGGYQGEVKVYAKYLDPTLTSTIQLVPGLDAKDQDGTEGTMVPYGMGHVELESSSGALLQLAEGVSAQLTVPVPPSLLGTALPTIPLWSFDEGVGVWKEEGSAVLDGDHYVGDVSHFCLWNTDLFLSCNYNLQINFECTSGPLANMPVLLRMEGLDRAYGVTNEDGWVRTYVPCNATFDVYVIPPGDSQEYFIGSIQTYPSGDLEEITLDAICGRHAWVSGRAITPNQQPVTNGYMYLHFGNLYSEAAYFNANGEFDAFYYDYTSEQTAPDAQITAWDLANYVTVEGPSVPFNEQLNVLAEPIIIGGSSASIAGRIYTGGFQNSYFYCLDASDGSVIWTFDSPALASVSPVVADNRVYLFSLSGELFCLNAFDGSVLWSNNQSSDSYAPFLENGVLYCSNNYGRIRAIDAVSGSEIWTYDTGAFNLISAPTIAGNTLYCGGNHTEPGMLALNKATGSLLWQWDAPDEVNTSPCVAEGKVFFGCDNMKTYALDAATGTLQWERDMGTATSFRGALTAGQGLVYAQTSHTLVAMNTGTGNIVWQQALLAGSQGGGQQLAGDRLYSCKVGGPVYCFNAATGATNYTIPATGSGTIATNFLEVDGVLLLSRYASPSTLEARNAQNGELIWTGAAQNNCTAPVVLVDDNGVSHYSSASGMQQ